MAETQVPGIKATDDLITTLRGIRDRHTRQKSIAPSGAPQQSVIWSQILVILQQHHRELTTKVATDGAPSGQTRGTAGTARIIWLRHCIQSFQSEAVNRLAALLIPKVEKLISDRRGRQAMGVDIGVCPVSVISNNQRCRDCSPVRCTAAGNQVATSIESGRPFCETACSTHQRQRER